MTNTSATGGYLIPSAPPAPGPLEDDALADFFQAIIVGLTGLGKTFVRPKWQQDPANNPGINVNWCALGITLEDSDTFGFIQHITTDDYPNGADVFERHENLSINCHFYGPNAGANASMTRDGLLIAQNRDALTAQGMAVNDTGKPRRIPDFLNERWYPRVDIVITIRRCVTRVYPILDLLSAEGTLYGGDGQLLTVPFTVTNEN